MANITQHFKNLIQGVSQQPPLIRYPEQLDEQVNGLSTVASGLQKRPPTLHLATESSYIATDSLVHVINRDESEQYVTVFTPSGVHVWDVNGVKKEVVYESDRARSYTCPSSPRTNLKLITVADHTFIVNRTKVARMNEYSGSGYSNQGVLVYLRSGQYGRTYSLQIGKQVFTHTTPIGDKPEDTKAIGLDVIRDGLLDALRRNNIGIRGYGEAWICINTSEDVKAEDGFNNKAMQVIKDTVTMVSDLPASAPDGYTVKVMGEAGRTEDDFYVKYSTSDSAWVETVKPSPLLKTSIDGDTMPHVMIRRADGSFYIQAVKWARREVGDEDSNPEPSFIGKRVADLFFYRNRLGLIAGENVCLSRSGDYFNFWVASATEMQDTDPIDLGVSHNKVSILYSAVPFNEDLYLFSQYTQFVLSADGILSPKNARLSQVTEFSNDKDVTPVGAGRNLYFVVPRSNYTSVREYFAVRDALGLKDAIDITSHVPNLIPNGVYSIISSSTENMLIALTSGQDKKMYVYKYLYGENQRVQSSWSEWQFDGAIVGADFIGSSLYIVLKRGGATCIEKLSLATHTKDFMLEPYRVHLDHKAPVTLGDESTFDVAGAVYKDSSMRGKLTVVLSDGRILETDNWGMLRDIPLDARRSKAFVGVPYEFKAKLSTFYLKKQDESGTVTIPDYRLMIRYVWFNYYLTGYFAVTVSANGKQDYTYTMGGRILGMETNVLNKIPIETGKLRVPVQGRNTETSVTIHNSSPLPVSIVGGGWDGNLTYRFRRV